MGHHPNPDSNLTLGKNFKNFVISVILNLIVFPAFAATTHHFQIEADKAINAGVSTKITLSAFDKDGALISDAHHQVTVVFSNPEETITKNLEIVNGQGTLEIVFNQVTFYLIQVTDNQDPSLTRSGSIRVKKAKVVQP